MVLIVARLNRGLKVVHVELNKREGRREAEAEDGRVLVEVLVA